MGANRSRGHNQITSLATARTLGRGLSIAASAVVAAGGTGYAVGDRLTVSGGTFVLAAIFRVTSVSTGGVVTGVELAMGTGGTASLNVGASRGIDQRHGVYTSTPANPAATTTNGSGAGCTLTVTYTADAIPKGARAALIEAETQSIRWRDDGTAPTATVGHVIAAGSSMFYEFGPLSNVQIIETAASAKANITFYS